MEPTPLRHDYGYSSVGELLESHGTAEPNNKKKSTMLGSMFKSLSSAPKFFVVLIASLAALSLVGYVAHPSGSNSYSGTDGAPTVDPGVCTTKHGVVIAQNTHLFTIPAKDQIVLEVQFIIDGGSESGNLIKLGADDDAWPGIYYDDNLYATVRFQRDGSSDVLSKTLSGMEPNREYLIRVEMNGYLCKVFVDGALRLDFAVPSNFRPVATELPIFASGAGIAPVSGMIGYITACTDGAVPLPILGCRYDAATRTISAGASFLEVLADDKVFVQGKVKINAGSASGNVIRVGSPSGTDKWPAISYAQDTGSFTVTLDKGDGSTAPAITKTVSGIAEATEYVVQVEIDGLVVRIFVDSEVKYVFEIPEELLPNAGATETYKAFVGDAVGPLAAGTVFQLYLCTGGKKSSLSGEQCREYKGGELAKRGDPLFTTATSRDMDVSFKFTVHQRPDKHYWMNLFHIGEENIERNPGVWIYPNGVDKTRLYTAFCAGPTWGGQEGMSVEVQLEQEYHLRVTLFGRDARVYLDGVLLSALDLETTDRFYRPTVPVYASDPWYVAANATIEDIRVCTDGTQLEPPSSIGDTPQCQMEENLAQKKLARSSHVFDTPVGGKFELSFKMTINELTDAWRSIVSVGEANNARGPSIFLWGSQYSRIRYHFQGGHNDWSEQEYIDIDIELGVEYDIRTVIDNLDVYIYFGDDLIRYKRLDPVDRLYGDAVPVYAANPWYLPADAVVTDLKACTSLVPSLCRNYEGGPLVSNEKILTVQAAPVMDIQFYAIIETSSDFGSILHFGDDAFDQFPGIYFTQDGVLGAALGFQFGKKGIMNQLAAKAAIPTSEQVLVRVLIQEARATVFLDGEEEFALEIPMRYHPADGETLVVYAGRDTVAKGWINSMIACSGISPKQLEPEHGKCQYNDMSAYPVLVRDVIIMRVPVKKKMDISFYITFHSMSPLTSNIISVGATNEERAPGLWIIGNQKALHFAVNGGHSDWSQQDATNPPELPIGERIFIRMILDGLDATIYLDDNVVGYLELEENDRFFRDDVPVYVTDHWHEPANATMTDLRVCYFS